MLLHLNKKLIGILFICAFLVGCVNLEAVGKFSEGAQALSEASGKFYTMALETDRQLAKMTVYLGSEEESKHCKNNDGTDKIPWKCATEHKELMSEARRNRAAVAALAQYAKSLNEIATFNDDENIEKASQALAGNLSNLRKTLDNAANPDEEALSSAILGLADIFVNVKVRKIIYQKINLAHEHVETIVNTLRKDIKRQQTRFAINRLNSSGEREKWFMAFREGYRSDGASESEKAFLTIAAGKLVEDELKDQLAERPSMLFVAELDHAAESLLKAHEAIQNPDLSDKAGVVVKFVKDARALLSNVSQLSN
jgi:hypothetical protein